MVFNQQLIIFIQSTQEVMAKFIKAFIKVIMEIFPIEFITQMINNQ